MFSLAGQDSPFSYRQGMNAICAPLLYCMPEVDAYHAFVKLVTEKFPLYWTNDVVGAEAGCKVWAVHTMYVSMRALDMLWCITCMCWMPLLFLAFALHTTVILLCGVGVWCRLAGG